MPVMLGGLPSRNMQSRRQIVEENITPTSERCFIDRSKTKHINATISAHHTQLRHLLVLPDSKSSDTVWSIRDQGIVENSFLNPEDQESSPIADLNFRPVCLVVGCGYVAAGGTESQLALRPAVPGATWTLVTSIGSSINNSIEIAPSLHHTNPLVYVANNDCKISISALVNPDPTSMNRIHQLASEEELTFNTPINHSSVSPDGAMMVAVGDTNDVFLHEISRSDGKHRLIGTQKAGNDASFSTSWSRNSLQFAIASQDSLVSVWDIRNMNKKVAAFKTSPTDGLGAARCVTFSKEGVNDLLAFTQQRGYVHVVDARNFEHIDRICVDKLQHQRENNNGTNSYDYIPEAESIETRTHNGNGNRATNQHISSRNISSERSSRRAETLRNRAQAISRLSNTPSPPSPSAALPLSSSRNESAPNCPEDDASHTHRTHTSQYERRRSSDSPTVPTSNNWFRDIGGMDYPRSGDGDDDDDDNYNEDDEGDGMFSQQENRDLLAQREEAINRQNLLRAALSVASNPDQVLDDENAAEDVSVYDMMNSLANEEAGITLWPQRDTGSTGGGNGSSSGATSRLNRRTGRDLQTSLERYFHDHRRGRGNTGALLQTINRGLGTNIMHVLGSSSSAAAGASDRPRSGVNYYYSSRFGFDWAGELVGLYWGPGSETLVVGTQTKLIRYQVDKLSRRSFPIGTLI